MPIVSGGGGAAAYSPPITRAQYATTVAVSIANNASGSLTWSLVSGTALLSLTSPAAPTIVTAGTYAVSIEVKGEALTAGGYYIALFDMDAAGEDPQFAAYSNIATATLANPRASLGGTYYVPAGGVLDVLVTNKDGAASRDFQIVLATVQRLS